MARRTVRPASPAGRRPSRRGPGQPLHRRKQEALFVAPDAFYRQQGGDALDGAPTIAERLQDLRTATLEQARDDGERAALGPRLDAHIDDAMDGIGRHVAAQRTVHQRQVVAERQALIRRAAELEHDNDESKRDTRLASNRLVGHLGHGQVL